MKLIYEKSIPERKGYSLGKDEFENLRVEDYISKDMLGNKKELPEVSEVDVVRHFTELSKLNYGVDTGFYPLGSCTMKYNPKVNEKLANLDEFAMCHPLADCSLVQGNLELMYRLEQYLREITGMDRFSFQAAAGAHGELVGTLLMRKYFESRNEKRTKMIIPDSAHGTNPASSAMAGYQVVEVKSNQNGVVDVKNLKELVDENTAGIMLTNPNTVGLFEENILEIAEVVHNQGGLLYYDGANLNALLGIVRPGDVGFDIVHLNLHKTFATPHGAGGPGAGAVGVKGDLVDYLPGPVVSFKDGFYSFETPLKSIGRVRAFHSNFTVLVKAYAWILAIGKDYLREVAENSIINANYIMKKLKNYFKPTYDRYCMHECVLTAVDYKDYGIRTLDIAKRLMDYGFHPPTIYFPHFEPYAHETIMIEPTETEAKETLDAFIEVMIKISDEAKTNPELLKEAPHITPVSRPDETKANRNPILSYKK